MSTVSIIVPTYRRPRPLRATLESLLAIDYPSERYQVIIVDDGDDDETHEVVARLQSGPVRVHFERQRNAGAAAARNRGARAAAGELLLFCDDDILVEPQHIQQHLGTRARHGDSLVNGDRWYAPTALRMLRSSTFGRYRIDLERGFLDSRAERPLDHACSEVESLSACNLALRRDLFWELGGFDESFPYAGAEDQDLSLRARHAGCRLLLNHDIRLFHDDGMISFRQFCAHEEKGAQTIVVLARKFPDDAGGHGVFVENRRVQRADPPKLVAKKLIKLILSRPLPLTALHRLCDGLARKPQAEPVVRRLYTSVAGLHIFRGVRRAL